VKGVKKPKIGLEARLPPKTTFKKPPVSKKTVERINPPATMAMANGPVHTVAVQPTRVPVFDFPVVRNPQPRTVFEAESESEDSESEDDSTPDYITEYAVDSFCSTV